MPLPKTYWDNLSEEAKTALFDFYMADIPHCHTCPIITDDIEDCCEICSLLFTERHSAGGYCPCDFYGPENAMAALEKALIDNGWIEDESVLTPDKED